MNRDRDRPSEIWHSTFDEWIQATAARPASPQYYVGEIIIFVKFAWTVYERFRETFPEETSTSSFHATFISGFENFSFGVTASTLRIPGREIAKLTLRHWRAEKPDTKAFTEIVEDLIKLHRRFAIGPFRGEYHFIWYPYPHDQSN